MEISRPETPEPQILLAEEISTVRSVLGSGYTDIDIIRALNASGNNPNRAINALLDSPKPAVCTRPVRSNADAKIKVQEDKSDLGQQNHDLPNVKKETSMSRGKVDSARPLPDETFEEYMERRNNADKKERKAREDSNETLQNLTTSNPLPYLNPRPIRAIKPPDCVVSDRRLQVLPNLIEPELGNFPEEHDWFLVGKTYVAGLSTCRGKKLLDAGEIVHFAFPSSDRDFGGVRVRPKTAAAMSAIVRFSTKRSGEVS